MTYADRIAEVGRRPVYLVEMDLGICSLTYSVGDCDAAIGTTGTQECWNTKKTCQDPDNFDLTTRTYRFSNMVLPPSGDLDFIALPCLKSVDMAPTKIEPGKGLGQRASVVLTFQDFAHPDTDEDPYLANRAYTAAESGQRSTFWVKLLTRNPYYQGRPLRIRIGYLVDRQSPSDADFQTRLYLIEKIDGPDKSGQVRITAKDPLKKLDDERAQAPFASTGELLEEISAVASSLTLTPAGIGAEEYPASGHVRIGDEILRFTRTGDVLAVDRGRYNTTAVEHSAEEPVQLCRVYDNATVTDVLYDLLVNDAGIAPAYITLADWEEESETWLSDYRLTTVIAEPVGVNTLVGELSEQCLFSIWWDEREQKVKFKPIRPSTRDTLTEINDTGHILADSQARMEKPNERLTEVWVYLARKDPTLKLDERGNYALLKVRADLEAESPEEYGDVRVKEIFSRWLGTSNTQQARKLGARLLNRYRDNPKTYTFRLDAKDSAVNTGDVVSATMRSIIDFTGETVAADLQVIACRETKPGSEYEYEAQDTLFRGRYGFITPDLDGPDPFPVYSDATDTQRARYGFICPDTGRFADATEGYKII